MSAAGREEILNRRIGRDELGAIDVCHAYVDAQREYAGRDRMGDGVLEYAQYLMSTPGKHDGLYWPAKNPGDEISPLGPLRRAGPSGRISSAHRPVHRKPDAVSRLLFSGDPAPGQTRAGGQIQLRH